MTFAFFGTDRFSVIVLDELTKAGYLPTLVVTAPDRPQGRKLVMTPPPAKVWAKENGVEYVQPEKLSTDNFSGTSWDLFIVASYGKIIPQEIIELPEYNTLNVHPSLLPKLRGASPVQTATLTENETGVSIMRIDEKMDHGPLLAQKTTHVWTPESVPLASQLEIELAHEGGKLLAETIPGWLTGDIVEQPQDHGKATFTKKITKADGLINFSDNAETNYRKIRSFTEWPRAYFFIDHNGTQKRVIITDAELTDGTLVITKVLPEGSKEMRSEDFIQGYGPIPNQ